MSTIKWAPEEKTVPHPGSVNKGGLQNDASPEARNPNPTAVTPREGTEPGEGLVPHPGGGFAKGGSGGFSGGCIPNVAGMPLPEPEVEAAKKKPEVSHGR